MKCVGQQIGQRHDNDDFSQQREEYSLLLFPQRFEHGLADVLEQHEDEG